MPTIDDNYYDLLMIMMMKMTMVMVMRHRDKHLGPAPDLGRSNKEAAVAHTHMHSLNALVCNVHCLHLCTALLYTHSHEHSLDALMCTVCTFVHTGAVF